MEAKYIPFEHVDSDNRIREILDASGTFVERDDIPSRDLLTYKNGFYVYCGALFIDIRGSSELAKSHTRPVLGKLYRAYISECVAVLNGDINCKEVFINGDCVSGIFNAPLKADIDSMFDTAAKLNSIMLILNWRLEKKGYSSFAYGIGMGYGRALMQKAGYKGSGINDVIWMGDVVNEASNLCHKGARNGSATLQVSEVTYNNLNDHNKGLLRPVYNNWIIDSYEGNVIWKVYDDYLRELKANSETTLSTFF